ncbi:MAG TPA: Hpt domain-containing protein, partial [Kofleriaceae bacterium]|nr:Hpt domain-containing protein [Kofleriaceae bacterium]
MSQRREALLARYRAISLERLKSIRSKLAGVADGNPDALGDVRRELHTLKGDSHLLGLVQIGKVAHACEERLLDPRTLGSAVRVLGDALDAIKAALRDDIPDPAAGEDGLRAALVQLSAAPPELTAPAPPSSTANDATPVSDDEPYEDPTPEQLARLRPAKP